jgi:hypothetical protein
VRPHRTQCSQRRADALLGAADDDHRRRVLGGRLDQRGDRITAYPVMRPLHARGFQHGPHRPLLGLQMPSIVG